MSTCESVDLPEPLGPISAWTSPDEISRSTPRRISRPWTVACRSRIDSVLTGSSRQRHQHVVAVRSDLVHVHRARCGQALRLAGRERERRTVLGALDLALVAPHHAVAE